ncbi:MAG: acylphosphatase [Chlorobi bacterium]|nr:acylphosphatase [Chlorobiota bacterium]MCI0716321.1 acylphosphatase [Chlorobiota bacterium]
MNHIEQSSVKITVSGRVQGVGFRYFIARIASELRLKGFARNLFNGDVEISAEGRKEFLEELVKKAKEGPSHSRVETCKVQWLDFKNKYDKFEIL